MADETIDIEVKATTDMSDVESLQQAISELNESIVDLTVAIDDSSIDDTIEKKEELSEDTEFTVNSDDSGIDDALEKAETVSGRKEIEKEDTELGLTKSCRSAEEDDELNKLCYQKVELYYSNKKTAEIEEQHQKK